MDIFVLGAVAVLSAMAGFWAGRSLNWQLAEAEGATAAGRDEVVEKSVRRGQFKTVSRYREIGAPTGGEVDVFEENSRRKVRIQPRQGKVYAPASGKITHLYPMGSAMELQTDFGARILVSMGSRVDEMCSEFYRCRVMENEVVRKGMLIMEYDPEGIEENGGDAQVILSIENEEELGPITLSSGTHIKAGEPILYVACETHSESSDRHS